MSEHDIPAAAKELAKKGQLIEAVKAAREQTGLGLKDAKNAVDAYLRNPNVASRFSRPREALTSYDIPPQAIAALEEGRFVEAVKHTRAARALGLKAAKETVECFLGQHADIDARFKAASSAELRRVAKKLATILVLLSMLAFGYIYLQAQ